MLAMALINKAPVLDSCGHIAPRSFCLRHAHRHPLSHRAENKALKLFSAAKEGVSADVLFVATNNFRVKAEFAEDFENVWKNRESHLNESPGFIRFALLRGDDPGEYKSETYWASRKDFENWTKSQQFSKAHGGVGKKPEASSEGAEKRRPSTMEMLEGPPQPKFYEAVTVTEKALF